MDEHYKVIERNYSKENWSAESIQMLLNHMHLSGYELVQWQPKDEYRGVQVFIFRKFERENLALRAFT